MRKPFLLLLLGFAAPCLAVVGSAMQGGHQDPTTGVAAPPAPQKLHPVTIHQPAAPPRLRAEVPGQGEVEITCSTCHSTRAPDFANRQEADLDQFHQGLTVRHGKLTCLACHNPTDYDQLRLADGKSLEFRNVMTLCGQCHGPQFRDYQHGSHGGMTGYWDLTKGPRARNNCIDCHDPHAPAFPLVTPVFPPADRFMPKPHREHDE